MKLYTYYRSSAAYRVRIALRLKGLAHEQAFVHLRKGEQSVPSYRALNPQGVVPTLEADGAVIGQSLAILEYLEETRPRPPLLPDDWAGRARVRQLALTIACEIHPLNNLKVLNHLATECKLDEAQRKLWYHHWVGEGFRALEGLLAEHPATGRFCHGDRPGLADICLVPQVYNARRFQVDLALYPTIRQIEAACLALPAFTEAAPEQQPDAE
ncbi:MAG: maleylacetoacetate isomerase [Alphaproteobacteria bacterium]|nr:maleylacetoacetate isomerase [Alphaproteobacteria bacterium]